MPDHVLSDKIGDKIYAISAKIYKILAPAGIILLLLGKFFKFEILETIGWVTVGSGVAICTLGFIISMGIITFTIFLDWIKDRKKKN
ncbi:MAG: hypothetical protein PHN19_03055 [Patescibacteria group bacterium]|nr:hypothetical protein [Patescibacteria group bacterium]